MKLLIFSFKQSLQSAPAVFKELNRYFGFYFIGACMLSFALFGLIKPLSLSEQNFMILALVFLSKAFTVFMIPYYAFKIRFQKTRPFWVFIGETIWPVVLNSIKAFFVILLFFIFLIVPGVYKAFRLTFLVETVFFDKLYKEGGSALKFADKSTRGYFWSVVFCVIFGYVLTGIVSWINFSFLPSFLNQSLSLILDLYISWFAVLFKTQLYFEIKKRRGDELSP